MEIVAIDGPSGVGKSSVSRALAHRLGYYFFSSGILYRAMAWYLLQQGWEPAQPPVLDKLDGLALDLDAVGNVLMEGQPLSGDLRTQKVSAATSILSALPAVRERSNALQRQIVTRALDAGLFSGVIIEGRDIGTVVFPDARCKFFLTATPLMRAERRFKELATPNLTLEETLRDLKERDHRDETRALAPLKAAEDALVVDTTEMPLSEVVETLSRTIQGPLFDG